jgi:dTDP-4-dehydrorhamnose reductase
MDRGILLIGWSGQLGYELERHLGVLGAVTAVDQDRIDLSRPDEIRTMIRSVRPGWIVNAAAYTAVDVAESQPALAQSINAVAPGIIGEEAQRIGAGVVHYSTDYVFDGRASDPYPETAPTNPRNIYGQTKLEGERLLAASGAPFLVLRTSWLYATRGKNFLLTILRLAQERPELRIVGDQTGAPTWARMVAAATSAILARLVAHSSPAQYSGVYHLTAAGQTTWAGFAQAILDQYPASEFGRLHPGATLRTKQIQAIATGDYPTPAKRPAYSLLSNQKVWETFGIALPDWQEQLRLALG